MTQSMSYLLLSITLGVMDAAKDTTLRDLKMSLPPLGGGLLYGMQLPL